MLFAQRTQQQQHQKIPKTHGIHLDMEPQPSLAPAPPPCSRGASNAAGGDEVGSLLLQPSSRRQTHWPGRAKEVGGLEVGDRDRQPSGSGGGSDGGTSGGDFAAGIVKMEDGTAGYGGQGIRVGADAVAGAGAGAGDMAGAEQREQQSLHESSGSPPLSNNACIEEFFIGPEVGLGLPAVSC